MTVDGRVHSKRAEAGAELKALLARRLESTPPETTTPLVEVAELGGLAVNAQTTTVIEDEVRLVIPDAHIEHTYTRHDWQTADPATVVNRLERQLQRLPDTLASARADTEAAQVEASRADARIGQPWDHTAELARLRRRQQEIDEALAATVEPVAQEAVSPPPSSPLESAACRVRQQLDAVSTGDPSRPTGLSL